MTTPGSETALTAATAASVWQNPPTDSRITRYKPDAGQDKAPIPGPVPVPGLPGAVAAIWFWDNVVDPDCT